MWKNWSNRELHIGLGEAVHISDPGPPILVTFKSHQNEVTGNVLWYLDHVTWHVAGHNLMIGGRVGHLEVVKLSSGEQYEYGPIKLDKIFRRGYCR